MLSCPNCTIENVESHLFCTACGTRLQFACDECGALNLVSHSFCASCGAGLNGSIDDQQNRVTPSAVTPAHLADRLLSSFAQLRGERKIVTILFADLASTTSAIEGMDPEAAGVLIDPAIRAMAAAVHKFEGTVARVQGDGIMALFGAPIAHEDHAVRACHAALDMRDAILAASEVARERERPEHSVRIGLTTGEVVVRAIRNDLSMDYDAVGPSVHLASRMEQLAVPNSIRLTRETFALAKSHMVAHSLGLQQVRGLTNPIEIFELVGAKADQTRLRGLATQSLMRFVGRDNEYELLRDAFHLTLESKGQTVGIIGEPGVGKSRLCLEFSRSTDVANCRILDTAGVSYRQGAAFLALSGLAKAFFQVEAVDGPDEIKRRIEAAAADASFSDQDRDAFFALLDVPVRDPGWHELLPQQRRVRVFDALRRLFGHLASLNPLILIFEDVHWMDDESRAFVDELESTVADLRILVILTYRPGPAFSADDRPNLRICQVEPLRGDSASALMNAWLGKDPSLIDLRRTLMDRTHGNPFFIEEIVRSLVESGVIGGEAGAHYLADPNGEFDIPSSLEAVIAARLDRLSPQTRQLLQAAAVIGKDLPLGLLRRVMDVTDAIFDHELQRAETAEIVYQTRPGASGEYTFKHWVTQDVAYRMLLKSQRRELHARVVAAIEELYQGRYDEQIDRLADHAFRGELWEPAVQYLTRACSRAIGRANNLEAIALFERGLESLEHLPDSTQAIKAGIDLRLIVIGALLMRGELERLVETLAEADRLASLISDNRRLGRVNTNLANALWLAGDYDKGLRACERALDVTKSVDDFPLLIATRFNLGLLHHGFGDFAKAIEIWQPLAEDIAGDLESQRLGWPGYPAVFIRSFLSYAFTETGGFARAEAEADRSCAISDRHSHPYSQVLGYTGRGALELTRGNSAAAIDTFQEVFDICIDQEVHTMHAFVAARLGMSFSAAGRYEEAIPIVEDALERETYRLGGKYTWFYLLYALSEACVGTHELDRGLDICEQALALANANAEHAHRAHALRLHAEIFSALGGDTQRVEADLAQATQLAAERNMQPLLAQVSCTRGEHLSRVGDTEAAAVALDRARELYEELGIVNATDRLAKARRAGLRRIA